MKITIETESKEELIIKTREEDNVIDIQLTRQKGDDLKLQAKRTVVYEF